MSIWKKLFGASKTPTPPKQVQSEQVATVEQTPPKPATATTASNPKHEVVGSVNVMDFRSKQEQKMESDARTGNVKLDTEVAAKKLYDLWRTTTFDISIKDRTSTEQVLRADIMKRNSCDECDIAMKKIEGGLECPRCRRRILFSEFIRLDRGYQKGMFRHKVVIEIGEALYKQGGHETMQAAGYRFNALGGRTSDLSRTWNGTGDWSH